jgi:hypothetical protein
MALWAADGLQMITSIGFPGKNGRRAVPLQ